MMRYRLTEPVDAFRDPRKPPKRVEVILRATSPDARAKIEIQGDGKLAAKARDQLLQCYGYRGMFLEEETTPVDLDIAMHSPAMERFQPERLEGDSILRAFRR
jgi:hypothetical protein